MTEVRRRVVMTGAEGRIGRAIAPWLAAGWDLQGTDVAPTAAAVLDIRDLDACRAAFWGADAVVHLAAVPDPGAVWEELLPANVIGAYHVAQAARDCGVRRLVLASSIQAVSGYPEGAAIRPGAPPRPANLYGATKAWAEALGAWVATTSETSVVVLRIGAFRPRPPAEGGHSAPDQAAWLGPQDGAELVRAAVEGEGFCLAVAQGVSGQGTARFPHGWAVLPVATLPGGTR